MGVTENLINTAGYDWKNIELSSGGAAFSDHIGVVLALKYKCRLRLHLPCEFNGRYVDTGVADWRVNPGRLAN